jgi:hypothetical protein
MALYDAPLFFTPRILFLNINKIEPWKIFLVI